MSNYATLLIKHLNIYFMKSRITIEVDFDNGQPYIRVIEDFNSDDVRDKLLSFFRQRLGHGSSWCRINFSDQQTGDFNFTRKWTIRPITPDQMGKEANEMLVAAKVDGTTANELPSQSQIGDEVIYGPSKAYGSVIAIKFTKGKVFYDVLDDTSNHITNEVPSEEVEPLVPVGT